MSLAISKKEYYFNTTYCPMGFDFQCYELMTKFGAHPGSYLHIQPYTEVFHVPDQGFVSIYKSSLPPLKGTNIIFARPVCAPDQLENFLVTYLKIHPRTLFMGIDLETAQILQKLGYYFNQFGVEVNLDLRTFDLNTKSAKFKKLRRSYKYSEKGFSVVEKKFSEIKMSEIEAIEQSWKACKTQDSELFLLTRPPSFSDEPSSRNFFCYRDNQLVGYVLFDPMFENNRIVGYTANVLRSRPDVTPTSFLDFTMLKAIEKFQNEGVLKFSLGLSPLHSIEKYPGDNWVLRWILKATYNFGNFLYSFKNVAYHKNIYGGEHKPLFVAGKNVNFLPEFIHVLKATGLI